MSTKIEFRAELLRTLHRIQQQRADLTSELERGPRKITAGEQMVTTAIANTAAAKETLKQAKLASDERQLQLKSREAKIEDLKAKLNTAASNREFDLLKEQIAADDQANAVLSDEILEGFEVLDELETKLKETEEEQKRVEAEQEKRIVDVESRMVTVRENLEHVNVELEKAEKDIPSAAKADYIRLIAAKGQDALAAVSDQSCGGCYQTLTTQTIDRLRLSTMVRCPNCNAFLYLPEDTRVK